MVFLILRYLSDVRFKISSETEISEEDHQLENLQDSKDNIEQESILSDSNIEDNDENEQSFEHESINQYENVANESINTNLISDKIENIEEDQIGGINTNETSVKRLSLFDNISNDIPSEKIDLNEKSEPIISENIDDISSITCETGCIFPRLNSLSGNVTSTFSFSSLELISFISIS